MLASASETSTSESLVAVSSIPESTCRLSLVNGSTRCCADDNLSLCIRHRFMASSNADVSSSAHSTNRFRLHPSTFSTSARHAYPSSFPKKAVQPEQPTRQAPAPTGLTGPATPRPGLGPPALLRRWASGRPVRIGNIRTNKLTDKQKDITVAQSRRFADGSLK